MILHCKSPSCFAFTPGRAYSAQPGGLTPGGYYIDLRDDAGALQRFALKPRARVRNEHPLAALEPAFDLPKPQPADMSEFEIVARRIADGGYTRPLILTRRYGPRCAKTWVLALEKLASTEVRHLGSASDYNSLLASGPELPPAIYVSSLRDLFVTATGAPSPSVVGVFDLMYDTGVSLNGKPD